MRMLAGELTPQKIAFIRRFCKTAFSFERALERRGYHPMGSGCYRTAWRYKRGKYVVKVATCYAGKRHTISQNKHFASANPCVRARMIPFLAYGNDFQVQEYVKECHRFECRVPGFGDTAGHNHTHRKGKLLAFDWIGVPNG